MGKITYLRPRRSDVKPVLVLLTSHRLDCFLVCVRCLERFTDFSRLARVYVLANAVDPDHLALARRFAARHDNVSVLERGPRGLMPTVRLALNEIYARHIDDVIIKLDEDVFVTPYWLEHLLDGYLEHLGRNDAPLVMPLVPISSTGRQVLNHFLRVAYPSERHMFSGPPVEENWVYHRWMWEKLMYENLAEVYLRDGPAKYDYVPHVNTQCLILDRRVLERVLSFGQPPGSDPGLSDEKAINALLHRGGMRVAVLGRSLAHHYSHARCEDYLRSHVPLDRVWRYLQEVAASPATGGRCRAPNGPRELTLLRAGG
jgi:hypothetical protein